VNPDEPFGSFFMHFQFCGGTQVEELTEPGAGAAELQSPNPY
jgi:hypothetical protein